MDNRPTFSWCWLRFRLFQIRYWRRPWNYFVLKKIKCKGLVVQKLLWKFSPVSPVWFGLIQLVNSTVVFLKMRKEKHVILENLILICTNSDVWQTLSRIFQFAEDFLKKSSFDHQIQKCKNLPILFARHLQKIPFCEKVRTQWFVTIVTLCLCLEIQNRPGGFCFYFWTRFTKTPLSKLMDKWPKVDVKVLSWTQCEISKDWHDWHGLVAMTRELYL